MSTFFGLINVFFCTSMAPQMLLPTLRFHAVHATMRHRTYTSWVRIRDVLVSLCSQDALAGVLATTAAQKFLFPNLRSSMDKWSSQLFDSPFHLVHFTMREVTRLYFDCMRRKEGHGCTHRQIQALIGPLHRVGRFPCSLTSESTDPFLF